MGLVWGPDWTSVELDFSRLRQADRRRHVKSFSGHLRQERFNVQWLLSLGNTKRKIATSLY